MLQNCSTKTVHSCLRKLATCIPCNQRSHSYEEMLAYVLMKTCTHVAKALCSPRLEQTGNHPNVHQWKNG